MKKPLLATLIFVLAILSVASVSMAIPAFNGEDGDYDFYGIYSPGEAWVGNAWWWGDHTGFTLYNIPDFSKHKYIWMWIYDAMDGNFDQFSYIESTDYDNTYFVTQLSNTNYNGDYWPDDPITTDTFDWNLFLFRIDPQCLTEVFFFNEVMDDYYIEVYSKCVIPEPTTMVLLGLGLLGIAKSRKRR